MAKAAVLFCVMVAVFYGEAKNIGNPIEPLKDGPPPHQELAKMARYILHVSEWTSMSTISTHEPIVGYPFVNVFSVSDGPVDNSTGIPYMYLTDMEISVEDLKQDPRASLTMTLAQSDYCVSHKYDPESPLCAHAIFTGEIEKVTDPEEKEFAHSALFSRHPEMKFWPKGHGWFFAKLNVKKIYVLDYFGGIGNLDLNDYYNVSLN